MFITYIYCYIISNKKEEEKTGEEKVKTKFTWFENK